MKITRKDLKSERVWRATVGMNADQFERLLVLFSASYRSIMGSSVAERQDGLYTTPSLQSEEALLLFTLFCYKSGLTNDVLGVVTGMDASNVQRNRDLGTRILSHTMKHSGYLPMTSFASQAAFETYFIAHEHIIIDGQEQPIVRPQEPQSQRDNYSGKKKTHTVKTLIIANFFRKILYISPCWCGSTHDYTILKQTFSKEISWFKNLNIRVDSGFQGFEKDYAPKNLYIPKKRSKKNPLTAEEKEQNKLLAKIRIRVEHAIGGLKRFRILSDKLRMHNFKLYHSIQLVCAGLWNFCLDKA